MFNLLQVCGIPATFSQVESILLSHPDYPSLLSMAESLEEWGIQTEALREAIDDLTETGGPGIVHFNDNTFAVLQEADENHVIIIRPGNEKQELSPDTFANTWSGVILRVVPESLDGASEQGYRQHRKKEYMSSFRSLAAYVGFPALALLAFGYGWMQMGNLDTLLFLGIAKLTGLFLCAVMVAAHMGTHSLLSDFCPMGKVSNCHRVLWSPAGKLLGIPLADIGLVYFSGGFLTLLFSLLTNHTTQVESALFMLWLINLPALPYTLFSVVYQAAVVRSLCWPCLTIQALFWIEYFMLSGFLYPPSGETQTVSLVFSLPFVIGFGLSLLVWFTLRPVIIDAQKTKYLETKLKRLSRNPLYIQSQLDEAPEKEMGRFPLEVEVGPGDAEFTLTLVINPFCSRCGKDILELDRMIRTNDGHINGVIRFMTYGETGSKGSLDYEVSNYVILLAREGRQENVMQALKEWYSLSQGSSSKQLKKQFDKWKQNHPLPGSATVEGSPVNVDEVLQLHRDWVTGCGINKTPAIFINGAELPDELG
ncbi:MAG: hypothetical protein GY940_38105, partial [bacterium]|nr:hypothetical protein [bacterium]